MTGKKLIPTLLAIEEDEEYTTEYPGTGIIFRYRRISYLKYLEIQEQHAERGKLKQEKVNRKVLDLCLLGWENYKCVDKATGKQIDAPFVDKYKYGLPLEIATYLAIKFLSAYVEIETELKN